MRKAPDRGMFIDLQFRDGTSCGAVCFSGSLPHAIDRLRLQPYEHGETLT